MPFNHNPSKTDVRPPNMNKMNVRGRIESFRRRPSDGLWLTRLACTPFYTTDACSASYTIAVKDSSCCGPHGIAHHHLVISMYASTCYHHEISSCRLTCRHACPSTRLACTPFNPCVRETTFARLTHAGLSKSPLTKITYYIACMTLR